MTTAHHRTSRARRKGNLKTTGTSALTIAITRALLPALTGADGSFRI